MPLLVGKPTEMDRNVQPRRPALTLLSFATAVQASQPFLQVRYGLFIGHGRSHLGSVSHDPAQIEAATAEQQREVLEAATPRHLFDAIGDLALAIKPHNMDRDTRDKVKAALHVLVDHIIAVGEARAILRAKETNGDA